MPLTDDMINEAFRRYRREYYSYAKLAEYVADKCKNEIVRVNALRAAVTARAKEPVSFRRKLSQKYRDKAEINTVDDGLRRVTDLAGVRVSTYLEQDRNKVVEEIQRFFDPATGNWDVDVDRKDYDEKGEFYRATHVQVVLKADDLEEPYQNLEGITCEVQVCSMLAHVWNEIEHDLGYKPTTGELSDREKESLDILGNLTLSGDVVIKQLFDTNTERLARQADDQTPFRDVYDFVARIRQKFPNAADFGTNVGQLFDDLTALGLNSPASITTELLEDGYQDRASQLIGEFQQYLVMQSDVPFEIVSTSSDLLLMLLLEKRLNDVVQLHPMGRGRGRPPRIASVAARFRDMRDEAQTGEETV